MSTEVKIVYAEVEAQLSEMTNAKDSLVPTAEPPITGAGHLIWKKRLKEKTM